MPYPPAVKAPLRYFKMLVWCEFARVRVPNTRLVMGAAKYFLSREHGMSSADVPPLNGSSRTGRPTIKGHWVMVPLVLFGMLIEISLKQEFAAHNTEENLHDVNCVRIASAERKRMSTSTVLHPDGTDYDAFLYAEIGQDRAGAALTVLSALARLGIEPWTEARELTRLGKEAAETRLKAHFAAITDVPALALAGEGKIERLISLLPLRAPLARMNGQQTAGFNLPKISMTWLVLGLVVGVIVLRFLYLAQLG